ncbi:type I-C CRISPR-associated protein Cas8c/Csd1 [Rhizobium laguerreae]|nr:type I-C CRISPR-associated protein Cas8c/Csd1 [Rhizobium laguerreae]
MTIISSLVDAFDALEDAPREGTSIEKIACAIVLDTDGSVVSFEDLRTFNGKTHLSRKMAVPQAVKRSNGVAPNYLWDKGAYTLGLPAPKAGETSTAAIEKAAKLALKQHEGFKEYHLDRLNSCSDVGLKAVLAFVGSWKPEDIEGYQLPDGIDGNANFVFALHSDVGCGDFVHDRAEAIDLLLSADREEATVGACLVTGKAGRIQRLHHAIKGVHGSAPSGANIVSYNDDAYCSYGRKQGDNAPVSEDVVYKYTSMLNRLLTTNKVVLGDTTVVYWVSSEDNDHSELPEMTLAAILGSRDSEIEDKKLAAALEAIRDFGELPKNIVGTGSRVHILGLAPNKSRLSVRFWIEDSFDDFVANYRRYLNDMRILPSQGPSMPPLWALLKETAVLGETKNVAPNLAGNWTKSILDGTRYPQTLFSSVLIRIRADGAVNFRRVSILKALLSRNYNKEVPVGLDTTNTNKGYLLGRLFAVYENAQESAVGKVNSSIKDKFYSTASSQPQRVFRSLSDGFAKHISKIRRDRFGLAVHIEKDVSQIMEIMSPSGDPFPVRLSDEEQAMFSVGYYHQRSKNFAPKTTENKENDQ